MKQKSWISDHVREAFDRVLNAEQRYARTAFAGAACPHAKNIRYPRGPGDRCYLKNATSFRITGEDPGQAVKAEEQENVPQDLIRTYRKSFQDGLALAFPEDALKAFLQERLEQERFDLQPDQFYRRVTSSLLHDFPRVLAENPRNRNGRVGSRRTSLEFDIRKNTEDKGLKSIFETRHDRQNLGNDALLHCYEFVQKYPEFYLGFRLWQSYVGAYAGQMEDLMTGRVMKEFLETMDEHGTQIFEKFPLFHVTSFTGNAVKIPQQTVFYMTAVLAQAALSDSDPNNMPKAEHVTDGLQKMMPAGFFRRQFETRWGVRKIICPFHEAAVKWLTMDLGEAGKPEGSAINRCIDAVSTAAPESEHLQKASQAVRGAIADVLKASDPVLVKPFSNRHS